MLSTQKKRASCHCLTTLGRGWEETRLQNRHPEIPGKKQWGHAVYPVPGTGVLPPPPMLPPELQSPGGRRRAAWTHRQVLRAPLPPADSDITHTRAAVPGKDGTVRGVGRAARPFRVRGERTWASPGLTSPPGLSVALPDPHHAAVYRRVRVSRAAASRTKSERFCFHHSRRAPLMETIQQNKKPDKPDKWPSGVFDSWIPTPRPRRGPRNTRETQREGHQA